MRTKIVAILLVVFSLAVKAQVGKQFWFAAPEMAKHSADMQLRLCVFADSLDADVTILNPHSSPLTIHLSAFSHQEVILAPDYSTYMQDIAVYHNQVMPRAIIITSEAPVSCYAQMTGVNGEIYTLKGENALGTDFVVALQNRFRNSNAITQSQIYTNAYSSAQIIATEDSTIVDIYPTELLYGDSAIVPRHILLNRGEVYSIRAASKRAQAHPVATRIVANHPISVLTMDDSMSPYQKYFGEDAVAEQQVPLPLLGNDYIAIANGTKWEGVFVTDLTTDSTEFISMNGQKALYIHRDHPIQVFQLTGYGNEAGGTQLPSLGNSGSRRVIYSRPTDSKWTWMHILTPTENKNHILINAQRVDPSLFQPVPEAAHWSFATINVSQIATSQTIVVTSDKDIFHLSVIDASSAAVNAQGKAIPTSCSFGYFSSYGKIEKPENPEMIEALETPDTPETLEIIDTLEILDTLETLDTIDTPTPHHFTLYMEGAYSHLPFGNRDFTWGLGYGAGIGFLYEYENKHFLLNLGVGFLWQDVEHRSQTDMSVPFTDTQGDESTLMMRIKRSDRVRMGYVEVPVLIGGIWKGFYLLGGVKAGVPLFGNTRCEARMTNYAVYDQYFVPFSEMSNHGLQVDVPTTRTESRPKFVADTRASLELGLHLDRYRLGLFADYGVLWPKLDNGSTPWMQLNNPVEPATWELHHPLASSVSNGACTHTLLAGVKFTIRLL